MDYFISKHSITQKIIVITIDFCDFKLYLCATKKHKTMSKEKILKEKQVKKAPTKTLKEKRLEKAAKKKEKANKDQ